MGKLVDPLHCSQTVSISVSERVRSVTGRSMTSWCVLSSLPMHWIVLVPAGSLKVLQHYTISGHCRLICCRFLLPFIRPYGGLSWYLASLLPTSAASLFAAALVNWERVAAGVQANTLWLPVTQGSGYCVGSVMWLLMMDVLLYGALTWYCDKVRVTGS